MNKAVKEAVDYLVKSYGDINAQANTFAQHLTLKEVQADMAKVDVTSVEYTVLTLLEQALKRNEPPVVTKPNADSSKE